MPPPLAHNPFLAWVSGLIIVLAANSYVAYLFYATGCAAPALAQFMILIVVPAVYLALMYLTLKRQP